MRRLLGICLFFSLTLQAEVLTLQESIDSTLKNYPDVKSFTLKVKQSKASYEAAFADYLPQVDFNAQYNVTNTYALPVNGVFQTKDEDGWNAGVNLKQKVWDFSKTSSKVNAIKIDKDLSALSLNELKAFLAYKVKSLYKLMIVQSEAVAVRKKDLESKKAYYEQAKALVEQGLKTKADASRFLYAVYNARDDLAIAKSGYEKAKSSLSLYMGKKIDANTTLESDLLQEAFDSKQNVQKEVLDTNYNLKMDSKTIEKNILLYKSAKAAHYGSLDIVASYNHIDTLNAYDSKLAGITYNIPIYSGGRVSAQAQEAQISSQISQEQKRSRELALKDETETLVLDIKRYNETIEAKKAGLFSAKETQNVLDGRYKAGLATYIEVLDATSLVLNANLGLLEAYYSRALSIDRIEYLKGKI